jgi:hypothetical protein
MVTLVAFAFAKNAPERRASGHSTAHGHREERSRVFRLATGNRRSTRGLRIRKVSTSANCCQVRNDSAGQRSTCSWYKRLKRQVTSSAQGCSDSHGATSTATGMKACRSRPSPQPRQSWRPNYGKARYCSTAPLAATHGSRRVPRCRENPAGPACRAFRRHSAAATTGYFAFDAVPGAGFGTSRTTISRSSVMSSMAYLTPSRPSPESFTPP